MPKREKFPQHLKPIKQKKRRKKSGVSYFKSITYLISDLGIKAVAETNTEIPKGKSSLESLS